MGAATVKACAYCEAPFDGRRAESRYCSRLCGGRARKGKGAAGDGAEFYEAALADVLAMTDPCGKWMPMVKAPCRLKPGHRTRHMTAEAAAKYKAGRRAWYHANREQQIQHMRDRRAMMYYGLTEETYERLVEHQAGRCAMCREPFGDKVPHIDHDHSCCAGKKSCGKCVRGLLCAACNMALGAIEARVHLAQAYLADFPMGHVRAAQLWRGGCRSPRLCACFCKTSWPRSW